MVGARGFFEHGRWRPILPVSRNLVRGALVPEAYRISSRALVYSLETPRGCMVQPRAVSQHRSTVVPALQSTQMSWTRKGPKSLIKNRKVASIADGIVVASRTPLAGAISSDDDDHDGEAQRAR